MGVAEDSPVDRIEVADPAARALSSPLDETAVPLASRMDRAWWLLLIAGLLLRFLIMPSGGYPTDIASFQAWAATMAERGPARFYGDQFVDYFPGYLHVLWGIGELHAHLRLNAPALLFALKLPAALADLLTAALVRRLALRYVAPRAALALGALYLFHPALVFVSAYWGQADSVGALLALAALALFLRGPQLLWTPVAALSVLIKPQTAPLTLVLGAAFARHALAPPDPDRRPAPNQVLLAVLLGAGTILLLAAPYGLGVAGLVRLARTAATVYPSGSLYAFNLWGAVQGFWQSDAVRYLGIPAVVWGLGLLAAATAAVLAAVWRRPTPRTIVLGGLTGLVAAFLLPTRIHERYLLPALPLLTLALAVDRRTRPVFWGLSLLLLLNLLYAYTRPQVQTFGLPPWLEQTVFSEGAVRAYGAAALLALPWLFTVLLTGDSPAEDQIQVPNHISL